MKKMIDNNRVEQRNSKTPSSKIRDKPMTSEKPVDHSMASEKSTDHPMASEKSADHPNASEKSVDEPEEGELVSSAKAEGEISEEIRLISNDEELDKLDMRPPHKQLEDSWPTTGWGVVVEYNKQFQKDI